MSLSSNFILPTLLATSLQVQALPYEQLSNTPKMQKPTPNEICQFMGQQVAEIFSINYRKEFADSPELLQKSLTLMRVENSLTYSIQTMSYLKGKPPMIHNELFVRPKKIPIDSLSFTFDNISVKDVVVKCSNSANPL